MKTTIRCILSVLSVFLAAAPAWPLAAQQQVDISLEQFGVAQHYRPGDFVGIQVRLVSNLDEARNVQVVWEVPEGLGDIQEITRKQIALTPGIPISTWLYAKLLPTVDDSTVFTVRVYQDEDGTRGRELGGVRIDPRSVPTRPNLIPRTHALIGVVGGTGDAAIGHYNAPDPQNRYPATGHEPVQIAPGIPPVALPDRWEGLDMFEALLWTDAQPGSLRDSQARAIREWVQRGGHFIIILSQTGNDWQLGSSPITALHDLLPQTQPASAEVTTFELLPVISKRTEIPAQANIDFPIRVFETIDNGYAPLLALPDERVIAIERRYGFGRITILGLDVASRTLAALGRGLDEGGYVLDGEMIWNLVLGKRQDTLARQQIQKLNDEEKYYRGGRSSIDLGGGDLIVDQISLSSGAFAGIGLALVLFIAYWLLAGPIGFGILKSTRQVRHAWVAFALTSVVFTALAWGSVKLFSQKDTKVRHITFLDYIAENDATASDQAQPPADALGPKDFRVTSWFTVFLPGYGKPDIALEGPPDERNLIAPFTAPGDDVGAFTNVDRYVIDIDNPDEYEVPARSTTKEMYVRYIGGLAEGEWGAFEVTEPIELSADGSIRRGRIIHDFPGALTDLRLIIVQPGRVLPKSYTDGVGKTGELNVGAHGSMPLVVQMYSLPGSIQRMQETSLVGQGQFSRFDRYMEGKYRTSKDYASGIPGGARLRGMADDYMFMLSFYNMITPPEYQMSGSMFSGNMRDRPVQVHRHLGRELDLSEWLTRPCVILYGRLDDVSFPAPLTVDGSPPDADGDVIVRFIYPLPITVEDVKPAERVEQ